jgi:hypothetical protein
VRDARRRRVASRLRVLACMASWAVASDEHPNFPEPLTGEVRRIALPRARVSRGKKKAGPPFLGGGKSGEPGLNLNRL